MNPISTRLINWNSNQQKYLNISATVIWEKRKELIKYAEVCNVSVKELDVTSLFR